MCLFLQFVISFVSSLCVFIYVVRSLFMSLFLSSVRSFFMSLCISSVRYSIVYSFGSYVCLSLFRLLFL